MSRFATETIIYDPRIVFLLLTTVPARHNAAGHIEPQADLLCFATAAGPKNRLVCSGWKAWKCTDVLTTSSHDPAVSGTHLVFQNTYGRHGKADVSLTDTDRRRRSGQAERMSRSCRHIKTNP